MSRSRIAVLRVAAAAALTVVATCGRDDRLTGPLASISDAAHLAGNRNFFFLPPLVRDPSGSPDYDPLGFDPTVRPAVLICRLEDALCAASQPAGFPQLYTMEGGPDGETVRLLEADQQFVVKWHAGDFHLNPASDYRITVLVRDAPLGHADVDIVNDGRELRNVNTNEFIGLIDGRTLSIKFRIERGAIAAIDLAETIVVDDHTSVLPPVLAAMEEAITVADAVAVMPMPLVAVREEIVVSDQVRALPPAAVQILETIALADALRVLPPAIVSADERLTVLDETRVLPPAVVDVPEILAVADLIRVLPAAVVPIGEAIGVTDHAGGVPPISIAIDETIVVTDAVAVTTP